MTKITQTYEASSSKKLRDFAKKFERPAPPVKEEAPLPAPRDDIFDRMDVANKLEYDNSLDATIDVFPDTRYPFIYIVFNVMKLYKTVTTERPILTPASFVSYCLFQLYAFALINDYYGRPTPSFPASQFMNDDTRAQLLDMLTKSFVPPFMLTLFSALADCSDPKRPGLQYFCTLAGSRFEIDFGRYLPAQLFLFMHNISTEADTSRDVPAALQSFLDTTIFRMTTTAHTTIRASNYFAAGTDNGQFYPSFIFEAMKTLFSPVTGKSLLRRTNIQDIPVTAMNINLSAQASSTNVRDNVYVHFLNADSKNARNMFRFIASFSNIVKSDLKGTFQLGAVPDDLNGVNILVHGYTRYALPTWHDLKSSTGHKFTTPLDEDEYATKLGFMQPTTYTSKSSHPFPDPVKNSLLHDMYLILSGKHKESEEPADTKEIQFDSELHVAPRTIYLDPYTNGDGPISYSMLAGLLIESEEVDGSSVPMPNPSIGLSKINRDFLQGAVPLSLVRDGFHPSGHIAISPVPRTVLKGQYQKISHDLYHIEKNRLGYVDDDTDETSFPSAPRGFAVTKHIRNTYAMFSKLSFSTNPSYAPTPVTLNVWSPYRYVQSQDDQHPSEKSTYMIINHRTLYGTHVPLIGSRHPSTIIPLS